MSGRAILRLLSKCLTIKIKMTMTPTNEMLNEWFKVNHPNGDANDFAMYWAGIAAYAHLSSPGSEQWKREHGFKTEEQ